MNTYLIITRTSYSHFTEDLFFELHSMSNDLNEAKQLFKESLNDFLHKGVDYDSACQLIQCDLTDDEIELLRRFIKEKRDRDDEELRRFMIDHFEDMYEEDILISSNSEDIEAIISAFCAQNDIDMYDDDFDITEVEEELYCNQKDVLDGLVNNFIKKNYRF